MVCRTTISSGEVLKHKSFEGNSSDSNKNEDSATSDVEVVICISAQCSALYS